MDARNEVFRSQGDILGSKPASLGRFDGKCDGALICKEAREVGHFNVAHKILDIGHGAFRPALHQLFCADLAGGAKGVADFIGGLKGGIDGDDDLIENVVYRDDQRILGLVSAVTHLDGLVAHRGGDLIEVGHDDFPHQYLQISRVKRDFLLNGLVVNADNFESREADARRAHVVRSGGHVCRIQTHAGKNGNVLFLHRDHKGFFEGGILYLKRFAARRLGDLGKSLFRGDLHAVKINIYLIQRNGLRRIVGETCGDLQSPEIHLVADLVLVCYLAEIDDELFHLVCAAFTSNQT